MNKMSKRKQAYSLFAASFFACLTLSGCDRSPFGQGQPYTSGNTNQDKVAESLDSTEPSEDDLASCVAQGIPSLEYTPLTEAEVKSSVVGHWIDWIELEGGQRIVTPLILYHRNGQMIVPGDNAVSESEFTVRGNCICSSYYYRCNAFYASKKTRSTWMIARGKLIEISLRKK